MRFREANEVLGRIKTPEDGYKALAAAVIAVACDDYVRAILEKDAMRVNTIEKFFRSQMFTLFSDDVEGSYLIRRMREIAVTMKKDDAVRPVYMYDKNVNIQNRYASAAEAADDFHGDRRSITRACNRNTICYGHYWRYADV